jgi:hypothetical protein
MSDQTTEREPLDIMRRARDQMNRYTALNAPTSFAEKVVMGTAALEDLRSRVQTVPGPDPRDPLGIVSGIQIVESKILPSDRWIAYDRNGRIVAMGSTNSVRIFAKEPDATA